MAKRAEDRIKLPRWDKFVVDVLENKGIIFMKGGKPDKLFRVATFEGAKRAADMLTKVKVKNWILFSVEGWERSVALMATGILLRDLGDVVVRLYVENGSGGADGMFPAMDNPDKDQIKAFIQDVKA